MSIQGPNPSPTEAWNLPATKRPKSGPLGRQRFPMTGGKSLTGIPNTMRTPAVKSAFLDEAARAVLPYETVVGRYFNANFFSIIPGLLTGAGLTLTFVAILTALYHVHYDTRNAAEPVSGMPDLINGLSGKFLSSIVALVLSILFTFSKRAMVRGLRQNYEGLIASLNAFLPTHRRRCHGSELRLEMTQKVDSARGQ